jgi:hypothetical protein
VKPATTVTPTYPVRFDLRFLSGMAIAAGTAGALTLAGRGRALGLYGLLALAGLDLGYFCLGNPVWGVQHWRDTTTLDAWRDTTSLPPEPSGGRVLFLAWEPNRLMLHGVRLVNGYRGGIEPCKRLDYGECLALRLSSAAWHREATFGTTLAIPGLPPAGGGWYRVPDPLPRVRLVRAAVVSDDPARDLPKLDPANAACTTHAIPLDGGPRGEAVLAAEDPGRLRVETEAEGRRLLVVSDSYDPGWQVSVDGQAAAVERINGDFLGCVVGPGRHAVEFTFRPAALLWGRALSVIGCAVCLLLGAWTLRRRTSVRAPA